MYNGRKCFTKPDLRGAEAGMAENEEFFTCKELLRLNAMSGCILLAGENRLQQKIVRANVIETLDMADWANAGEVIITSGYPFRENESALMETLSVLQKKGISALCLKPRRFYNNISEQIIEKARELDFILIELPMEAIFSNIVHEITEEIFQKETTAFRNTQNKIEMLLDTMFKGGSMEERLSAIESVIQNPVLIYNSDNELLMSPESRDLLGKHIQEDFIRQFYQNVALGDFSVVLNEKQVGIVTYQVETSNSEFMRMILLKYYGPLSETDLTAVKRISRIFALEMKNAMAIKKIRRKYKDKFVQDWLFHNFDSEIDICISAHSYGYELNSGKKYRVAVINLNTRQCDSSFAEQDVSVIHHIIKNLDHNMIFTIHTGKLILIFESDEENKSISFSNLSYLIDRLKYILGKGDMSFCLSRISSVQDIPTAYLQAKKISEISRKCNITTPFITYEQLGILSLLALLPEDDSVRQYKDKFLSPLKQYDAAHHSDFLNTLQMYLNTKCNTKATAKNLYMHYNTVAYRIERIKNILNMDIEDVEIQLQLQIAFKLDLIQP